MLSIFYTTQQFPSHPYSDMQRDVFLMANVMLKLLLLFPIWLLFWRRVIEGWDRQTMLIN